MIAVITLIIVAAQFAIVMLILLGGKSARARNNEDRARNEQLIRENNAARKHIKAELATIKSMVAMPLSEPETLAELQALGGIVSPGNLNAMLDGQTEAEWQELINEGRDDLSR